MTASAMKLRSDRATRGQIGRYLVMTGLSACLTMGLPVVLHEIFGLSEEASVAVALLTAFVVNFITLRRVVFRSAGRPTAELLRFFWTGLAFRGGEYLAFLILLSLLRLHYVLALAIVLALSISLKFLCYRSFVFRSAEVGQGVVPGASP